MTDTLVDDRLLILELTLRNQLLHLASIIIRDICTHTVLRV